MAFYYIINMKNKDTFKIDGTIVVCTSSSGKVYNITKDNCSCAGFGFRRNCRHFAEAKKLGLFEKIEKAKKSTMNFRSPYLIEKRKKAAKIFIEKNGLEAPQSIINAIEPHITITMKPKKFLEIVRNLLVSRERFLNG